MAKLRLSIVGLWLVANLACASTTEPLNGHLEKGRAGEVVLTLELPAERLANLADKAGQESAFDVPALAELIRERFHYLLRLRVGYDDAAPTSVELPMPAKGKPLPAFLPLTATWVNVAPNTLMKVVTQADSPDYRLELAVEDRRAVALSTPTRPWLRAVGQGALAGLAGLVPGGVLQLLFVAGLAFSVRDGRELFFRLSAFLVAYGTALGLATTGMANVSSWADGIALATGCSVVALAVWNCFRSSLTAPEVVRCFSPHSGAVQRELGRVFEFAPIRWRALLRQRRDRGKPVESATSTAATKRRPPLEIPISKHAVKHHAVFGVVHVIEIFSVVIFAAAGALHGFDFSRVVRDVRWPEGAIFPAVAGTVCGAAIALLAAAGVTAFVSGARRPEIAIPASVAIGLGGLTWTFAL